MEGKTLLVDCFQRIGCDHFSGFVLNSELAAVEMSYREVYSSQGFVQGNFFFHKDVGSLALESFVFHLLYDNYHITGFNSGELVGLAVEGVLAAVWRSLVDLRFEQLLLLDDLLSIAGSALVFFVNHLSFASAVVARSR